jgi:hypothetical protein
MTYAEIRQQVLAQLSPEMDRAEIPALLHTLAYIALHRDAREAAADMLAGDGPGRQDRADFEAALSGLEVSWGQEIAALRAEIARQHGIAAHTSLGSGAVLAFLQREFIHTPTA